MDSQGHLHFLVGHLMVSSVLEGQDSPLILMDKKLKDFRLVQPSLSQQILPQDLRDSQ